MAYRAKAASSRATESLQMANDSRASCFAMAHSYGTLVGTYTGRHMATHRTKRTHILLPKDLAREIDAIAGRRGRSAFLVETAREAVRRSKLLGFLESDAGWKDAEHPELAQGAGNWVRKVRQESEARGLKKRNTKRSKASRANDAKT